MTHQELAYWIQGMLEYTDISTLSEADLRTKLQGIKDHVAVTFNKVTPKQVLPTTKTSPLPLDFEKAIREFKERIGKDSIKNIIPDYSRWPHPLDKYILLPSMPNSTLQPYCYDNGRSGALC